MARAGGFEWNPARVAGGARLALADCTMQKPLQIVFHQLAHSDAVEEYVRKRVTKLETLAPRITHCRVALEKAHRHANHGEHYSAHVDVTLPGGEVVVTRSPDQAATYEDLYAAIDAAFDDVGRRLQDFVRRRRDDAKAR
jgi:ribosomal subunit interface protein